MRVKDRPRILAYALKEIADYETGPDSHVTHECHASQSSARRGAPQDAGLAHSARPLGLVSGLEALTIKCFV